MKSLYLLLIIITTHTLACKSSHKKEADFFGKEFQNECIKKVSEYLQSKDPSLPGISIAIINPQVSTIYTWGRYSDKNSKEVTKETIYDLASISKLYTTSLILKLQEEKKINIYDYCHKYLPVFSRSKLRIIDLLTHKANFNIRLADYRKKHTNNLELKEEIFKIIPPYLPSNEVVYENMPFIYLGKIIEKVMNNSLEKIYENLFLEYGLKKTFLGLKDQTSFKSPPTEILGKTIVENITHDETARLLGGVAGHAGIFSTAEDLVKFGKIWIENDNFKKIAFQNYNFTGKLSQGLGWWGRIPGYRKSTPNIFNHTGFTGGILFIHIPSSTICAILTNRTYLGRDNQKHQLVWEILINEFNQ